MPRAASGRTLSLKPSGQSFDQPVAVLSASSIKPSTTLWTLWGLLLILSVVFSMALLTPAKAEPVSDEVATRMLERLEQLESEMRNLRGENEQLRNQVDNLQQRNNSANEQLGRRPMPRPQATAEITPATPEKTAENDTDTAENKVDEQTSSSPAASRTLNLSLPASVSPASERATDTASSSSANLNPSSPTTPEAETPAMAKPDAETPTPVSATAPPAAPTAEKTEAAKQDTKTKVDPNSAQSYFSYGHRQNNDSSKPAEKQASPAADQKTDTDTGKTETKAADTPDKPSVQRASHSEQDKKAKMAYNDAYKLLLQSPADAVQAFRNFLNNYPKSNLAGNAQYWLGEALYAQKEYSAASEEFVKVLKQYKDSQKAPGAALKLGYSFYEMKQWGLARRTLEDTKRFFPDSNAAALAQNRLDKMKAEGH